MPPTNPARFTFWRFHHDEWARSPLNQREYCELHGLPLKRFGNWRTQFGGEEKSRHAGLLYRRGGLRHMSGHMSDKDNGPISTGYSPSARAAPEGRRNFRLSDKKRIVGEALAPGASVSGVARRYGITAALLFRWKRELITSDPVFLPVTVTDGTDAGSASVSGSVATPAAGPIMIERSTPEIEVELTGGRRVRFGRDTDPETVRAMIAVLEGVSS